MKIKLHTLIDPSTGKPLVMEVSEETYQLVNQPVDQQKWRSWAYYKKGLTGEGSEDSITHNGRMKKSI